MKDLLLWTANGYLMVEFHFNFIGCLLYSVRLIKISCTVFANHCAVSNTAHLKFYGKYSTVFVFDPPTQKTIINSILCTC